jgi:hypothetical protein
MKTGTLSILAFLSLTLSAGAAEPAPCSIAVGVTTQFGSYRTWTNALETQILADKGLEICQDDAILNLSDDELSKLTEKKWAKLLHCKTEFRLELLFRPDQTTRNVTITKAGKTLFDKDYPPKRITLGSLKILKTIPTCAELETLASAPAPVPSPAVN